MSHSADRNLLFGILALQMDFITRDQLVAGMNAWVLEKSKPLGQILIDQRALDTDNRAWLDAGVERHLAKHNNDPQQSLAALGSASSARKELEQLADAELHASLAMIRHSDAGDEHATRTYQSADADSKLRFRILRPHAEGGLGRVSVARDEELSREVALKEIKERYAHDADSRTRFLREAEITGGLEHPGIVPVYSLGSYADGRPFYAMRFVRGQSLWDAIKDYHRRSSDSSSPSVERSSLRQLLGRFVDVCQAIQYAHDRGVLHRDLKPGNIMLGKYGETLVVDWGLAKARGAPEGTPGTSEPPIEARPESDSATQPGKALGTPAFMSPEQAAGQLDQLGPASDVYSLGATLYCLLTGRPPIDQAETAEMLRRVQRGEYRRPRKVNPRIDAALEAICGKAMSLKQTDRYAGAKELAEDVEHWLADEPVSAWPEPWTVKGRRFVGRHRVAVTGAAAALAVGLIISLAAAVMLSEANDANKKIADANKLLAEQEGKARMDAEILALRIQFEHYFTKAEEHPDLALVGMASLLPKAVQLTDQSLADSLRLHVGAWTQHVAQLSSIWEYDELRAVALSADGKTALTVSGLSANDDHGARLWDTTTGKLIRPPLQLDGLGVAVALSPDGRTALTAAITARDRDKTLQPSARLWDTATGVPLGPPLQNHDWVWAVALSVDAKLALTVHQEKPPREMEKTARIWDTATGQPIGVPIRYQSTNHAVALSADGKTALTSSGYPDNQTAQLWEKATGKPIGPPLRHEYAVFAVALSADGKTALTGSGDKTARLWDAATGKQIGPPLQHQGQVRAVALSADGKTALTGSNDKTARLWETATGKAIGPPLRHQSSVNAVALNADGSTALTASEKMARVWQTPEKKRTEPRLQHQESIRAVALSADGRTALTTSWEERAQLCARSWDTSTGKPIGPSLRHQDQVRAVALSADGKTALTGSNDKTARLWETATGKLLGPPLEHKGSVLCVALSADGRIALTGSYDNTAQVWTTATGRPMGPPLQHQGPVFGVALSADGKKALTGSRDKTARVWETAIGRAITPPLRHQVDVYGVALSADGTTALTGGLDFAARLWETATAKPIVRPLQHQGIVEQVALSADGKTALTGSGDRTARLWETATGKQIGLPLQHQDFVFAVALSGDGKTALTPNGVMTACLWNIPQPVHCDPARIVLWTQVLAGFEVDELTDIRFLDAASWQQRRQRLQELGGPPGDD